jgi:nitrate/nitrite transport system substrate-binding protein
MRRWGQIADAKPDSWYLEMAKQVYLPAIYREAAAELVAEGKFSAADFPPADDDGFRAPLTDTIDGVPYDGRKPNAYLEQFEIGLKGDTQL